MTKYLSDKLTILYTVLIVMVVYIHSYYLEAQRYELALFLQNFTGGKGVSGIANCLFFCISGYLFALKIKDINDVFGKQKKRFRTLIVPYILWNLIFVLWFVVLEYVPGISKFNNSSGIIEGLINDSIGESLYSLFVAPAAFQLWFLRDLLCMLLFTPLLWWLAKRQWIVALVLAFSSITFYPWLIYFWVGIILAVRQCDIENYYKPLWLISLSAIIYCSSAVIHALGYEIPYWIQVFVNLVGLYLLWSLYDLLAQGRCLAGKGLWKYICGYSFFIYCFHEPTFNIIKKLVLVICGTSEPVLIFFYFLNPWIMVAVAVLTAKLLQRITPQLYKVLTGGR